ncbi:50S ribosomal protein L7/L12 [Candidatus Dependentiae bacterium]|nr:50S ribosomal protein L7/L12 [Candidatus Dependentiae bacterium]
MAFNQDQMIQAIEEMSVLQLAELVKALETRFGVSAAAPMASGPAAAPSEGAKAEEEKTEYKVELSKGGDDKIKTIKALRSVTTLGLTEAKKAVEEAPTVIAEAASKDDAKKMKDALEAAGAVVKLS